MVHGPPKIVHDEKSQTFFRRAAIEKRTVRPVLFSIALAQNDFSCRTILAGYVELILYSTWKEHNSQPSRVRTISTRNNILKLKQKELYHYHYCYNSHEQ